MSLYHKNLYSRIDPLSRKEISPLKSLSQQPDPNKIMAVLLPDGLNGHITTIFLSWRTVFECPLTPPTLCWNMVKLLLLTAVIDNIIKTKLVPYWVPPFTNSLKDVRTPLFLDLWRTIPKSTYFLRVFDWPWYHTPSTFALISPQQIGFNKSLTYVTQRHDPDEHESLNGFSVTFNLTGGVERWKCLNFRFHSTYFH